LVSLAAGVYVALSKAGIGKRSRAPRPCCPGADPPIDPLSVTGNPAHTDLVSACIHNSSGINGDGIGSIGSSTAGRSCNIIGKGISSCSAGGKIYFTGGSADKIQSCRRAENTGTGPGGKIGQWIGLLLAVGPAVIKSCLWCIGNGNTCIAAVHTGSIGSEGNGIGTQRTGGTSISPVVVLTKTSPAGDELKDPPALPTITGVGSEPVIQKVPEG
jgi:hypothetical protein